MLTARVFTVFFMLALVWSVGSLVRLAWGQYRQAPESRSPQFTRAGVNRWLRRLAVALILPALAIFGMHTYWALFASQDEVFTRIQRRRDVRRRRIEESGLRGWILDRHQRVETNLAGYEMREDEMLRTYPLGRDAAHVVGYFSLLRGSAGAELAFGDRLRSGLSTGTLLGAKDVVGEDVTLTLDRDLQTAAAKQLRRVGKPGAIVMLEVHTGNILAMASAPTFDPQRVSDDAVWARLRRDETQPFVNRALNQYYLPGSTFKVLVAAAALSKGWTDVQFVCSPAGYRPPRGHRPIYDDRGPSEVHGRIGMARALRVSCNQYFAQLGVKLGYQDLSRTAEGFGFHIDSTPEKARKRRIESDVWCNPGEAFHRVFSPHASRLVLSASTMPLDLAYESYGQGFVQVTPLHMALVMAAIANDGQMMTARLDRLCPTRVWRKAMTADQAKRLQAMLLGVTQHPTGTAFRAFAHLRRMGLRTIGKTGTAEFKREGASRVDSWFIGSAPADRPRIAYAVVIEGGGYGSQVAAPIAAAMVAAATSVGLVDEVRER